MLLLPAAGETTHHPATSTASFNYQHTRMRPQQQGE
jgi:hypothetical protein